MTRFCQTCHSKQDLPSSPYGVELVYTCDSPLCRYHMLVAFLALTVDALLLSSIGRVPETDPMLTKSELRSTTDGILINSLEGLNRNYPGGPPDQEIRDEIKANIRRELNSVEKLKDLCDEYFVICEVFSHSPRQLRTAVEFYKSSQSVITVHRDVQW